MGNKLFTVVFILLHLKLEHGEFYRMLLVYLKLEHGEFYRRTSYTRPFKAETSGFLSYVTRLFKAGTWGVFIEGLVILVHLKPEHGEFLSKD